MPLPTKVQKAIDHFKGMTINTCDSSALFVGMGVLVEYVEEQAKEDAVRAGAVHSKSVAKREAAQKEMLKKPANAQAQQQQVQL